MYKIAISPSQQMDNRYTGVNTTEGIEMEKLGKLCHDYHISKGGESLLFDSKGIDWKKRPQAAKDFGASVYLVLHSNSGGGKGTVTLHASKSPNSKKVSEIINNNLTAFFDKNGFPNTRYAPVQETNFLEARESAKLRMAHSYVEVNFHDNAEIAKFMVKNWETIAKVIVDSVWEFRGWKEVNPEVKPVQKPTNTAQKLDTAQQWVVDNGIMRDEKWTEPATRSQMAWWLFDFHKKFIKGDK